MLLGNGKKNISVQLGLLRDKPEQYWLEQGEKKVLGLFHSMAERVPAYADFLKKNNIAHKQIRTIADFKKVPLISKDTYLKQYSLEDLCWDGRFAEKQWDISSTSGSTGVPYYFPREEAQNQQYAETAELYLRSNFKIHERSTLYVNCFALGVWIGGIFTYEALKLLVKNGNYRLSIISPGLNKAEIIKAVKNLGGHFDQVILGGYPPFIKDVLDDGVEAGMKWRDYHLGIIFSAEAFSEKFRDYIAKKAGLKNVFRDTLNHYGTVDLGTMAHETPLSVLARRLAVGNKKIYKKIFPQDPVRLPTLAQYDPRQFFFEEIDGGVICSGYSGLPLVRYDLKDSGGVISWQNVNQDFTDEGVGLQGQAEKAGIADTLWNLPFVYVYERRDLSVSLAGANIYPENVKRALQDQTLSHSITGKFTMMVKTDAKQDPHLEINIELKKDKKQPDKEMKKYAVQVILKRLIKENSEFRSVFYDQKQGKAVPHVKFWPYEHPQYFKVGGKQKWIVK